jgi:hypothetical protein
MDVPSDRVGGHHSLGTWLYFIVIVGVCLSFIVGGIMHRRHVYWFPESGATVRWQASANASCAVAFHRWR